MARQRSFLNSWGVPIRSTNSLTSLARGLVGGHSNRGRIVAGQFRI